MSLPPRAATIRGLVVALAAVLAVGPPAPASAQGLPCWPTPVPAPVAVPFVAPACTWCPGHRGLEYRPRAGTPVQAVSDGVVTFAGTVAGVRYLVVRTLDGRRVTYGSLVEVLVGAARRVRAGQVVGRAGPVLFLGVRQGNHHVDPAPLLCRDRAPGRVRLLPPGG